LSKVKPLSPRSVAAARRVLSECDVRGPRDIHVEAMAARYGAVIMYGPLATACGSIMRTREHAIIRVDEKLRGTPRGDFTGGHEFAHHLLHEVVDHFAQCAGEGPAPLRGSPEAREAREADQRRRAVEREAEHFTAELLMPEAWAAPMCAAPRPTLDDVHRVARTFRTSLRASAIRYVELAQAPCALVYTVGGKITRSTETLSFPGEIIQRRAVHPRAVAASLQGARPGADGVPREVPGAAWGDPGGPGFVEHAIARGPDFGVMSWIVPLPR
jgi:hypothetical protein